jgi:DNA-binding protein H-NS
MPTKLSYADMKAEIARLQKEADAMKQEEKLGVIGRIKEAIAVYGFSRQDLFDGRQAKASSPKPSGQARFADGKGNTWGGRGPRPQWLRDALGAGKSLEDFSVNSGASTAKANAARPAPKARRAPSPGKPGSKVAAKFKDAAGNTWSGRGLQPRWLRTAIEGGKSLDDFRI